jgi:hypothetical protein
MSPRWSTILVLNIKKIVLHSLSRPKNSHVNKRISEKKEISRPSILYKILLNDLDPLIWSYHITNGDNKMHSPSQSGL